LSVQAAAVLRDSCVAAPGNQERTDLRPRTEYFLSL